MSDIITISQSRNTQRPPSLPSSRPKNGGAYVTVTGSARKIDVIECVLILQDGTVIPIEDVITVNISGGIVR